MTNLFSESEKLNKRLIDKDDSKKFELFNFHEALKEIKNDNFNPIDYNMVLSLAVDLSNTYKRAGEAYLRYKRETENFEPTEIFLNEGISRVYLMFPGVYDKNEIYSRKDKSAEELNNPYSNRFTFTVSVVADYINYELNQEKPNEVFIKELREVIYDLFITVIKTFHPRVVSEILLEYAKYDKSSSSKSVFDIIFANKKATFTEFFETLVIREGILMGNPEYISVDSGMTNIGTRTSDLVFDVLGWYLITDPMDLLDDSNRHNWLGTILGNPTYTPEIKKDLFTRALLNLTVFDNTPESENNVINTCRFIRQQVTDWIKHTDLSERPERPEVFNYISMPTFMRYLYTYGLYNVGNIERKVNEFDAIIDPLESSLAEAKEKLLKDGNSDEEKAKLRDEISNISDRLRPVKEDKKHYLTLKSMIAFLFQEILSNEHVSQMVFTIDTLLNILVTEPGWDNAMHDVYGVITTLYVKRDFKPMGYNAVNPYFMHYNEGDVYNPDTELLSTLFASQVHGNHSARVALAPVRTFDELSEEISSVGANRIRTLTSLNRSFLSILGSLINRLGSKDIKFESEEDKKAIENLVTKISDMYSRFRDVGTIVNILESKEDISKLIEKINTIHSIIDCKYLVETLVDILNEYTFYIKSSNNVIDITDKIISNIEDANNIQLIASGCKEKDKRYDSFWPHIIQDNYPVAPKNEASNKSIEETHHENFMDLEPGDVESERYKVPFERLESRYSTSKGCD